MFLTSIHQHQCIHNPDQTSQTSSLFPIVILGGNKFPSKLSICNPTSLQVSASCLIPIEQSHTQHWQCCCDPCPRKPVQLVQVVLSHDHRCDNLVIAMRVRPAQQSFCRPCASNDIVSSTRQSRTTCLCHRVLREEYKDQLCRANSTAVPSSLIHFVHSTRHSNGSDLEELTLYCA